MGWSPFDLAFVDAVRQILALLRSAEDQDEGLALHAGRRRLILADNAIERKGKTGALEAENLSDVGLEIFDLQKLGHAASSPRSRLAWSIMPQARRQFHRPVVSGRSLAANCAH